MTNNDIIFFSYVLLWMFGASLAQVYLNDKNQNILLIIIILIGSILAIGKHRIPKFGRWMNKSSFKNKNQDAENDLKE